MALAHRHAWGLNTNIGGCTGWTDNETLVYTAGHAVVLYGARSQWDKNSQRFVAGSADGGEGFTSLALSPSRLSIAVAEAADRANFRCPSTSRKRSKKTNHS